MLAIDRYPDVRRGRLLEVAALTKDSREGQVSSKSPYRQGHTAAGDRTAREKKKTGSAK